MDTATEDIHLQKIEEFIQDEDKIVTFRWLSIALDIHVNESRRLLQKYVVDHRGSKPNDLGITYLLAGVGDDNVSNFAVVAECELQDKRDALVNIESQLIYSVQKCKQIELTAVGLVDAFDIHNLPETPIRGSIISKNCAKRVFKSKKSLPTPPPLTNKSKTSFFTKNVPKSTEKTETATSGVKQEIKESPDIKNSPTAKQVATVKPKSHGIASYFTKGTSNTHIKPQVVETLKDVKSEAAEVNVTTTKNCLSSLIDSDSGSEDVISPTQTSQKGKEVCDVKPRRSNKRPKKDTKKIAPDPKRRKRIIEQHDSDSDDIFGSDENTEPNLIDDSELDFGQNVRLKPSPPAKNKRRKQVDRTFTDEEGYVITRKEWVELSASEEEAEVSEPKVSVKIEVKSEEKKPKLGNETSSDTVGSGKNKGAKGKKGVAANQQTLMSFFKRK